MKRSEIIRRLEAVLRDGDTEPPTFYEARLLRIAGALGVTVEPDEPPLPDRVEIVRTPTSDPYGVAWNVSGDTGPSFTVMASSGFAVGPRRLLEALVNAYNERPRQPLFTADQIHRIIDPESKP